jgi:hypothetical protein
VQLNDLDNTSACETGYSDYTDLAAEITLGTGNEITITIGNPGGFDYGAVFIDWNQDQIFGYPSEEVTLVGSPGTGPFVGTVIAPPDAVLGETRMRVRISGEEDPPGPCGPTDTGEVEDYTVIVVEPSPCPADVNGDDVVNVLDLLAVIAAWGNPGGPEDVNGDGIVDVLDLLAVIAAWGPCGSVA